jgi:hypothetical protein
LLAALDFHFDFAVAVAVVPSFSFFRFPVFVFVLPSSMASRAASVRVIGAVDPLSIPSRELRRSNAEVDDDEDEDDDDEDDDDAFLFGALSFLPRDVASGRGRPLPPAETAHPPPPDAGLAKMVDRASVVDDRFSWHADDASRKESAARCCCCCCCCCCCWVLPWGGWGGGGGGGAGAMMLVIVLYRL